MFSSVTSFRTFPPNLGVGSGFTPSSSSFSGFPSSLTRLFRSLSNGFEFQTDMVRWQRSQPKEVYFSFSSGINEDFINYVY